MYRISYRFLVPGWSAKPLVSAHDRIMGTHTQRDEQPPAAPPPEPAAPTTTATTSTTTTTVLLPTDPFAGLALPVTDTELEAVKRYENERATEKGAPLPERGGPQ